MVQDRFADIFPLQSPQPFGGLPQQHGGDLDRAGFDFIGRFGQVLYRFGESLFVPAVDGQAVLVVAVALPQSR